MKDIKKSQQVQNKREKEKQIVDLMIHLYCRKKHKTVEKHHGLCEECEKLRDYAAMRVDKCPFMETKTFCSNCRVHCYKPQMREEIQKCDAVCRTENVILSSNHGNPARDHFCKRKKENGKERNI